MLIGFPEGYQVLDTPEPICNASPSLDSCEVYDGFDEVVGEIV